MIESHDSGTCSACSALANARLDGREINDPVFVEELHQQARGELTAEQLIARVLLRVSTQRNAAALRRLADDD